MLASVATLGLMAQTDYDINENQNGSQFMNDLNNTLVAIATNNSGTSDPATTYECQLVANKATGVMRLRNPSNTGSTSMWPLEGGMNSRFFSLVRTGTTQQVSVNSSFVLTNFWDSPVHGATYFNNGQWVCPKTGWYDITLRLKADATNGSSFKGFTTFLVKNTAREQIIFEIAAVNDTTATESSSLPPLYLTQGQEYGIEVTANTGSGSATISNGAWAIKWAGLDGLSG
ncbi:MAG: hypothetical protein AAF197_09150 [Pseudomonadota bacterium]